MPQLTATNRIVLKATYGEGGSYHEEGIAAAAVSPGMNVIMTTATEVSKRQSYTPGANPAVGGAKVVKENLLNGGTVDTPYASGDNLFIHVAVSGDILQLRVASGQTLAKGAGVVALASGLWGAPTGAPAPNPIAEVLESTGGAALTADTLMRARIL